MSKEDNTLAEEVKEEEVVQTVLKDNTLNALPVWTTVYVPYLSVTDDVYEVRECTIESIGDIVENNVLTIFYKCAVSNAKVEGETMTLNILANISTSYEEAERELHDFLEKQIEALAEHSDSITKQLVKNNEHIEMFTEKISSSKEELK